MKKISILMLTLSFLLTAIGCLYAVRFEGTFEGKVIDAETEKPISGVVVLGIWHTETPTVAGAMHDFYDAEETVTDENGEFRISGQGVRVLSNLVPMDIVIFKSGYEYIQNSWHKESDFWGKAKWEGNRAVIPLKKLTMEERIKQGAPPDPPTEASVEKVKRMLQEINQDRIERGLPPRKIWKGTKL